MEHGNLKQAETGKLITVGITGIFGSGKTTVAGMFREEGFPCFSFDSIVHSILEEGKVTGRIKKIFGGEVIREGKPDRKELARIVFRNENLKKKLEEIIHPLAFEKYRQIIFDYKKKGGIIVFEVPLLFETESEAFFTKIIVVSTSPYKITSRLEGKFSIEDIKKRTESQIPLRYKEKKAAYVVYNSGSISETSVQVKKIIRELKEELAEPGN